MRARMTSGETPASAFTGMASSVSRLAEELLGRLQVEAGRGGGDQVARPCARR